MNEVLERLSDQGENYVSKVTSWHFHCLLQRRQRISDIFILEAPVNEIQCIKVLVLRHIDDSNIIIFDVLFGTISLI